MSLHLAGKAGRGRTLRDERLILSPPATGGNGCLEGPVRRDILSAHRNLESRNNKQRLAVFTRVGFVRAAS